MPRSLPPALSLLLLLAGCEVSLGANGGGFSFGTGGQAPDSPWDPEWRDMTGSLELDGERVEVAGSGTYALNPYHCGRGICSSSEGAGGAPTWSSRMTCGRTSAHRPTVGSW